MKGKKIICSVLFLVVILLFPIISKASSNDLYLNNLEFNIQINSDGSMDVIELWDIDISNTNTLFKTFETDNTKYSNISNVKVTDITNNTNKMFTKIDTYMYHVTKDCYYGLKNSDGNFEIAWGVSLDNSSATRKYKIEYKVKDAIAKYKDYSELYWQFIGDDFEINAKNIKGTILLPNKVDNKEEIKVWGHTKDLNGTIYATDLNKIEFEVNNYRSGRYVEIRTLFPTTLINTTKRIYNSNILEKALTEETKWADEANRERQMNEMVTNLIIIGAILLSIIIGIYFIRKIKKYKLILKELNKYQPTNKLEYFRDLPDKDATPGEAVFLLNNLYNNFNNDIGQIFSATLLNLTLKKYISLEVKEEAFGKKSIKIIDLNKEIVDLKEDEKYILEFIKKAMNLKNEVTIKQLEKYIKDHPTQIERLIEQVHENVKTNMSKINYFDKEEYKKYNEYIGKMVLYIIGTVIFNILLPASIVFIINAIYCNKIAKKLNILTQTGLDQKEMWKGLKKYMEDFSLLKEREIPEIVIWEKYLVYATAFGIADKVLKQLKIVYPNIDEMNNINTSSYMYFMYHSNFNTNFSNAINSSIASATYSSGSGGGGGFSGGGGGGRWPVVAGGGR